MLPNDVGAAAAYEAYRTWKHNTFLYEPLSADRLQQREGLVGMAIAEGALTHTLVPLMCRDSILAHDGGALQRRACGSTLGGLRIR